jgi:hypothetical protein
MEVFDFFNLYVLELQENKWFLHFASPSNDEKLWLECASMFPFVKRYCPLKTFQVIKINDIFEIDYYVKKYMQCYGIENVRGGSYNEEILDSNTIIFLNRELDANKDYYFNKQIIIDNISKKYDKENDFVREKDILQKELVKYRGLCKTIETIRCGGKINRILIDDIEWLYSHIIYVIGNSPTKISKEDANKYRKIIEKIKTVVNLFTKFFDKSLNFESPVLLHNPEFILDNYFYHYHNKDRHIHEPRQAYKTIEYFEYMCYFIINRLEEYEFDLTTYTHDYESILTYSIEYLENIEKIK